MTFLLFFFTLSQDPWYKDVVFTFHELSRDEMKKMGFDKHFR